MSEELPDWQDGLLKVVVNHEEQYSLWPVDRDNPPGWQDAGKQGVKAECLEFIRTMWTDMRPLSVRRLSQPEEASVPEARAASAPED